jgi:hypothetical protein
MSQQENAGRTNQVVEIKDLTVEEPAQDEVKGGVGTLQKVGCGTLILPVTNSY